MHAPSGRVYQTLGGEAQAAGLDQNRARTVTSNRRAGIR